MRGMKLSVKLPTLIVLSVFVSALIIFALGTYMTRNSLRAVEMEASRNSVHTYAHAASFYLAEARSALETTAALPQITDLASAGLVVPALHGVPANAAMSQRNVAASMLKSSRVFEYIMLLKADGTIYLLEPYELQVKALCGNLAFKNWYQELMSGGKTVMSDLQISNTTQRPTITIATPVRSSAGQIIGIWAGGLKLEDFSQIARGELEAGAPQRYGYITDSRGLIIAHQVRPKYVQDQTDFSSAPPVRAALAGQDGAMQYICPIEGQEELGAYMPLPAIGWAVVYVVPMQIAFAPLTRLRNATLSITVIIAIIATIVGLAMVRQITKPLGQLAAATVKMGTGDLSQRVKVTTGDEIGQLGAEFNQMAVSLSEKEASLRQHAVRLEAANKELEAFSYSVSHDLRAPLRAIDGFSRVLLEDYIDKLDDEGKRYLNIIGSNTRKMGQLIDDLLLFSRLGRQEIRRSDINMEKLAKTVFEELKLSVPERKLQIIINTLFPAQGDQAMVRQVLVNLLSNSIKFTRPKETAVVEVDGRSEGDENIYAIKDNGVGFDMQYVGKLFGVFQRLHSTEEFEGTGVGLAIVQRIIHRHGGRVWAEGEVGKGATFFFTLPRREG